MFLVLRAFFVEAYRIPSGSMIPTLLVGDWLFVNKLVYGPHIPFTEKNLPGYSDPKRNDIVVFVSPTQIDQPEDPNPTLVKRLVGQPGDTLFMRKGILYLDGIAQRQGYGVLPPPDSALGGETHPDFDWQKQVGLKSSRFGAAPAQPTHDNWGPFVVPPRHFFMMGDNRYDSKDSRYWGFVRYLELMDIAARRAVARFLLGLAAPDDVTTAYFSPDGKSVAIGRNSIRHVVPPTRRVSDFSAGQSI